jgi:glycerol-3-phosphate O-acyltransferase
MARIQPLADAGAIFIRRQTKEIPVYRFVLRAYAAQLVQNHANLTWSIEGGRTRTGKLRPPVFGILRYITDAVEEIDAPKCIWCRPPSCTTNCTRWKR